MPALASDLRKTLEAAVVKARDKAEGGARDALTALAVGASEPFGSMSEEERKLRNRLRARGRQLGDQRDPQKGSQGIERLVREMAYEHWHRMLFARFLAENQLLIETSSGVSITLDECEELAAEEGTDLWGLAAQFAQAMLPQIFRTDDPVLTAKLPLEIRQQLQGLVAELEAETFTASDSLGWTYQFWQTKRKREVNDSGVKIGADEISPVTQLFTEDYMVDFLLDNTLGAWHAGKVLAGNPQLAETAQSEEELRQAVALPGCPWSYLRFIKTDDGPWTPAAGAFEGWPNTAAELKCLDPCMGSGHFVVAMFERLVALRLAEGEQLEATAVATVIEGNLFGLEIDPRCTQIAAFNLALAAWRRVGYCMLPAMNLACSGLAPNTREADWLAMAGNNERLRNGMELLYRLFEKASVLGSLINPRATENNLLAAGFTELQPLLEQALAQEAKDETKVELAVTAQGIAKAATILTSQFTLVTTNVPYLGRPKQTATLRNFCDDFYPLSKADLSTSFIERASRLALRGGSIALVTPQNWLFLPKDKKLRKATLENSSISTITRLGPRAFQTSMWDFGTILFCSSKISPQALHSFAWSDVSEETDSAGKGTALDKSEVHSTSQADLLKSKDSVISLGATSAARLLSDYASAIQGASMVDLKRFRLCFWEVGCLSEAWVLHQSSPSGQSEWSGASFISANHETRDDIHEAAALLKAEGRLGGYKSGHKNIGKTGVLVAWLGKLPVSRYAGTVYDHNTTAIISNSAEHLDAIWEFCSSDLYNEEVRKINQKTQVNTSALVDIPFDLSYWVETANERSSSESRRYFTQDPTQWLFSGHPYGADQPLQVAVSRLLGYQWPRQTCSIFSDCPALAPDAMEGLADADGIVCLSPIRGEAAAADRLRGLLAAAFGDEWSNAKERELLLETAVANDAKKAAADLGDWLRQNFFTEHCKLFQSRPFIWQIWDGNSHGFSALVNYHKLAAPKGQGRKTLELLTYTYLGDWIDRQKLDQAEGINGADNRLAAALDLQNQLKKILEGEPPYDIFVRWKPLQQQAIGWDPDINDGVRLNIRPFLSAQLRKGGKTGAGILRARPGTIKWTKDDGKEPTRSKDEFPWFWGWDENSPAMTTDFGAPDPGAPPAGDSFDGNRWNDLHYSRAAKEAARTRHRGEG